MALVDHLISLSEDECTNVSEKARNVLCTISENYMENYDMRPLIDSLEDKFYNLLTELPTIIRRSGKIFFLIIKNIYVTYMYVRVYKYENQNFTSIYYIFQMIMNN